MVMENLIIHDISICIICGTPLKKRKLPLWKRLLLRVEYWCPNCDKQYMHTGLAISAKKGETYNVTLELTEVKK